MPWWTWGISSRSTPMAGFIDEVGGPMSKDEIIQRLLCSTGRIDNTRLRSGNLGADLWPRVLDAADKLFKAPVFIDESSYLTVTDVRAKCRRLQRKHGLDLVIVDYLQLMQGRSRENRQQEIAEISRGLKNLARELDVPIIAVSQLNRSLEARMDKRPQLGDLRELRSPQVARLVRVRGEPGRIGVAAALFQQLDAAGASLLMVSHETELGRYFDETIRLEDLIERREAA